MNIIHYSIRSFFTNEYYSIIRFASKRLFVATLVHGKLSFARERYSIFYCVLRYSRIIYPQKLGNVDGYGDYSLRRHIRTLLKK